jgi:hypothetical protein
MPSSRSERNSAVCSGALGCVTTGWFSEQHVSWTICVVPAATGAHLDPAAARACMAAHVPPPDQQDVNLCPP